MIIDGNDGRAQTLGEFDLIIAGSGVAAQVLLPRALAAHRRVLVIESGHRAATPATDDLKAVVTPRFPIKLASRERFLGGSANTWGGGCVRLDPLDLDARPWVEMSGWPIGMADLEPYYRRALTELRIDQRYWDLSGSTGLAAVSGDLVARHLLHAGVLYGFDDDLLTTLDRSQSSHLLLGTNVVSVLLDETGQSVESLRLRTLQGTDLLVTAARVVLACGGIENPRLLLMSPTADGRGVGNAHDVVGRYFMEHSKNVVGWIRPANPRPDLDRIVPGLTSSTFRGGLGLSEAAQRRHGVMNSHVRFVVEWRFSTNPGVLALKALLGARSAAESGGRGKEPDSVEEVASISAPAHRSTGRHLMVVVRHLPTIARFAAQVLRQRLAPRSWRGQRPIERIWINNLTDMQPLAGNRVTLGDQVDALGCPVAVVDYAPSELDRRSLRVLHRTIADALPVELGVLESPLLSDTGDWPITNDASHHVGGTRMGSDPATSVVDPDCRVHGIDNLFVAGSSVFPSGGYANPTLTVVALTLRLADHLFGTEDHSEAEAPASGQVEAGGSPERPGSLSV